MLQMTLFYSHCLSDFKEAMKPSYWKHQADANNLKGFLKHSFHGDIMSQRQFSCLHCNQSFPNSSRLNDHIAELHSNDFPYICTICFKGYSTKMGLTYHMNIHQGRTYSCPVCKQNFTRMFAMKRHMKKAHFKQDDYSL